MRAAARAEGQASAGSKRSSVPALYFGDMGPALVIDARVRELTAQVKPVVAIRLDGSLPTVIMSTQHSVQLPDPVSTSTAEK